MTAPPFVVILYEDHSPSRDLPHPRYLDRIVRRIRGDLRPGASLALEPGFAAGAGNFAAKVREFQRSPRAPRFVVAVGDADAPQHLVPGFAVDRHDAGFLPELRAQWERVLREQTSADVFGVPLRWSSESVALAALDSFAAVLGPSNVEAVLDKCVPDPRTIDVADFVNAVSDTKRCLASLAKQVGKRSLKNDIELADVLLRIHASPAEREMVRARLPDLDVLAQLLLTLEDLIAAEAAR